MQRLMKRKKENARAEKGPGRHLEDQRPVMSHRGTETMVSGAIVLSEEVCVAGRQLQGNSGESVPVMVADRGSTPTIGIPSSGFILTSCLGLEPKAPENPKNTIRNTGQQKQLECQPTQELKRKVI
ncbi:uncharacterized [Tachysurus ichikawai]